MINIVADENIALATEAFSGLGNIKLLPGRKITNNDLIDADVLITRSVTKVDAALLDNTKIKFVGTATIGTDHIDIDYLTENNIAFSDAKGCNAAAVTEYVFTALYTLAAEMKISFNGLSIAIIGAGNIGSRVARTAEAAGMKVRLNDPPLKRLTGDKKYLELDEVLDADIVTLHVPLTIDGRDKTYHLIDKDRLKQVKPDCIFINSSRGEVVDNTAFAALNRTDITPVFDVWENEPFINRELLKKITIATPHIAGYSLEGKINGTGMIYNALCRYYNISPSWKPEYPEVLNPVIDVKEDGDDERILDRIFSSVYNINNDNAEMKKLLKMNDSEAAEYFDQLRKEYPLRRELKNFRIKGLSRPGILEVIKTLL